VESAEILRAARRRAGISQRRLALRAGTSQDAISRIERGVETPSVERLQRLLSAVGEELIVSSASREPPASPTVPMSPAECLRESASWNLAATRLEIAGALKREAGHPATFRQSVSYD